MDLKRKREGDDEENKPSKRIKTDETIENVNNWNCVLDFDVVIYILGMLMGKTPVLNFLLVNKRIFQHFKYNNNFKFIHYVIPNEIIPKNRSYELVKHLTVVIDEKFDIKSNYMFNDDKKFNLFVETINQIIPRTKSLVNLNCKIESFSDISKFQKLVNLNEMAAENFKTIKVLQPSYMYFDLNHKLDILYVNNSNCFDYYLRNKEKIQNCGKIITQVDEYINKPKIKGEFKVYCRVDKNSYDYLFELEGFYYKLKSYIFN